MNEKPNRHMRYLGATLAIAASLPLTSFVPDAASSEEKLSILRRAAEAGHVNLWLIGPNGPSAADRIFDQGFDNGAPGPVPPP
jgi:hypothetical protein